MQNTFSQSGNDSKWFLTKIIFQNRYVAIETPSRPPPFMANAILNFHFDYPHTSLKWTLAPAVLSSEREHLLHNKKSLEGVVKESCSKASSVVKAITGKHILHSTSSHVIVHFNSRHFLHLSILWMIWSFEFSHLARSRCISLQIFVPRTSQLKMESS